MRTAYISGALSNLANPDEVKGFYEAIAEVCSRYGLTPHVPHLYTDPVANPDISPREVFENDKSLVMSSDLVIAYVGIPSIGVGMELAYADISGRATILLYEQGRYVSRFPRGMPNLVAEIQFTDYQDALIKLGTYLERFSNRVATKEPTPHWYLSLKGTEKEGDLHIFLYREPGSSTQHLEVKNNSGNPIFISDIPAGENNAIKRALLQLAHRGVSPLNVYIEQFSGIKDVLEAVWPNAKIYFTYQEH